MKKIEYLIERDGAACYLCGINVLPNAPSSHPMVATIEHYIPRSRRGSNRKSNLRVAHKLCNNIKGTEEFSDDLVRRCKVWLLS